MKKVHIKSLVSTVVVVLFVCVAVWYVAANYDDFARIAITNPLMLIPAALFVLINIYGAGVVIDLAVEPHGVKLSRKEAFGLAAITRFSNQFSPSYINATIRATYLKRTYGITYAKFSSSFLISSLLQFMVTGAMILITFLAMNNLSTVNTPLIAIGVALLIFVVILYIPLGKVIKFLNKKMDRGNKISHLYGRLSDMLVGYETVRKHPGLFSRTFIQMVINIIALALVYFTLFEALGIHTTILQTMFIASFTNWSVLFSVTPGNLGVREGLMVVSAGIAGVSIPATLLVAIMIRLITFAISGGLATYYTPLILNKSLFNLRSK